MTEDTLVIFPQGGIYGAGRVLHARSHGSAAIPHIAIIADQTPFHPVDHFWPDQPANRVHSRVSCEITPLRWWGAGVVDEGIVDGVDGTDAVVAGADEVGAAAAELGECCESVPVAYMMRRQQVGPGTRCTAPSRVINPDLG